MIIIQIAILCDFIYCLSGCPNLTENVRGPLRSSSTFRNGFRSSLALKKSPLSKASSLCSNETEATVDMGSRVTVGKGSGFLQSYKSQNYLLMFSTFLYYTIPLFGFPPITSF